MAAKAVTIIQPTAMRLPFAAPEIKRKRRVAGYARVSTNEEEQLTSYEAQVDYYTRHIQDNAEWEFVEVYTDEGISATSTKKRDGFNRMIADALAGKIDLILTKSVSRFARNTVDTLTTVRALKEKGVEVYFEKENIFTLDSKGELLITIMSSLAQEESRSISENVTWGQRKRFSDGKVAMPYGQFLGYEKGEDGQPRIVGSEAAIVRQIYKLFLEGKTPSYIAKYLTENSVPTPAKKSKWQTSTVVSILKNEKYKGDAVLQKSFTVDFLTKKKKVNEGEIPQYYVTGSHPAIISPEVYDLAQCEFDRRKGGCTSTASIFSGRIVCGECGGIYGSKVWHSNDPYRRTVWQCNRKFGGAKVCKTPHLSEDALRKAFVAAFNDLFENKDEILKTYESVLRTLTDTKRLDKEKLKLQAEQDVVVEMIRKDVEENASAALDQAEYNKRNGELVARYDSIQERLAGIERQRMERNAKKENIRHFLRTLESHNGLLTEFDEELWCATVEKATVYTAHDVTFTFKDGTELPWTI